MDKYIDKILDKRYRMLEIIGSGGMAVVYKALDMRLNRHVAAKILKDEFIDDEELRHRFRTESEAVAMLSHPNIVSVLDVSSSHNVEYFVMELIDGITLKQYMQQRGRLTPKEAVHFISLILSALGHAHGKNVIHRDVKPQNIMILRDGSLKVTDFGIARLDNGQNTLTPNTFGSVHYISPEQARGEKIDGRTDIYSVGVILYEMLAGKLPYVGETPVSVAIQHLNSEPVPLREIVEGIPESLETITLKAMCGEKEYRYRDAQDMLADIEIFRRDPMAFIPFVKPDLFASDEETRRIPRIDEADEGLILRKKGEIARKRIDEYPKARRFHTAETDIDQPNRKEYRRRYSGIGAGPLLAALLAIVLLAVGIFAVYRVILDPSGVQVDVSAPKLVGLYLEEIKSNPDYALFDIREAGREYSDDYEENMVMAQDPESGRSMKSSGIIYVTISRGGRSWVMSDLKNLEYRQAEIALGRISDSFIIRKEYEKSDTIVSGNVISTTPEEGQKLAEGEIITLLISVGAELQTVKVPDLFGMTETEARQALTDLNLTVGSISGIESEEPVGQVVSQSIPFDTETDEYTAVDFEVSIGVATLPEDPGTDPDNPNDPGTGSGDITDPGGGGQPSGPVTKILPVGMPSSPSSFVVKVVEDGVTTVYNEQHTPDDGLVAISLTRTGSHMYSVYIDGVFKGDQVIVFTE